MEKNPRDRLNRFVKDSIWARRNTVPRNFLSERVRSCSKRSIKPEFPRVIRRAWRNRKRVFLCKDKRAENGELFHPLLVALYPRPNGNAVKESMTNAERNRVNVFLRGRRSPLHTEVWMWVLSRRRYKTMIAFFFFFMSIRVSEKKRTSWIVKNTIRAVFYDVLTTRDS